MRALLFVPGVALVLLATFDTLVTTLAVGSGAGPVSGGVSRLLWRAIGHAPGAALRHRLLRRCGPLTVGLTVLVWFALSWTGWALVFAASGDAVLFLSSGSSTSFVDRILFAGSALVGGVGSDLGPATTTWRFAALLASMHGIFMLGLGVAYVIPVASAVAEKRKLAGHISTLGTSPAEIVSRSWNGDDFGELDLQLLSLVPELSLLAQRHLAYPLVHYFHSTTRAWAVAPSVAALDEALTLLWYGVPPDDRPDSVALRTARSSILQLLETLRTNFIRDGVGDAPPPPDLDALARCGVPVVDRTDFEESVAALARRRALLAAFVAHDGWSWEAVTRAGASVEPAIDTMDPGDSGPLRPVG